MTQRLIPDDFNEWNNFDKVKWLSEEILSRRNANSSEKALPNTIIYEEVKTVYESIDILESTFKKYLSDLVKSTKSPVNCLGRKQGYYLAEEAKRAVEEIKKEEEEETEQRTQRHEKEKLLYPLLEEWLVDKGYRSSNTSSIRRLGRWGNPDVVGLDVVEYLGDIKVEVVTIEAKTSFFDWEHWFFEAVSHRRFANRSYFAFAHPFEAISLIPQDMRYYSELYSVGVIVIGMETSHFELLKNGELSEIDINDVDIQEIYSAPYNHTQPKYQSKFLEALEIRDVRSLYNWGRVRS